MSSHEKNRKYTIHFINTSKKNNEKINSSWNISLIHLNILNTCQRKLNNFSLFQIHIFIYKK